MQPGHHVVSLSLGTVAEPSAVVVVEPRTKVLEPNGKDGKRDSENRFDVVWLERFPAGRPIPAIVARVTELVSDTRLAKKCTVLLDTTSTGAAPIRVFESRGLYPTSIDLTNSGSEERSGAVKRVPLRDVIGAAQVVLQTSRLKVASDLDLADTLVTDLQAFDPKPMARGLDLRGGRNSDLVFALAVALWWADDLTWADDVPEPQRRRENNSATAWMGM
jgi:hypothetical protein